MVWVERNLVRKNVLNQQERQILVNWIKNNYTIPTSVFSKYKPLYTRSVIWVMENISFYFLGKISVLLSNCCFCNSSNSLLSSSTYLSKFSFSSFKFLL
ncbi:MAG: hypothetical protein MRERC_4c061 [Mycoplasmataceae bacterium RC_NB112A]|nr:MAG: hypothetical protein MRERC_4c061 [Mycoplasmataceae bacterium RC_NB112A]